MIRYLFDLELDSSDRSLVSHVQHNKIGQRGGKRAIISGQIAQCPNQKILLDQVPYEIGFKQAA